MFKAQCSNDYEAIYKPVKFTGSNRSDFEENRSLVHLEAREETPCFPMLLGAHFLRAPMFKFVAYGRVCRAALDMRLAMQ
jgi:hypothetical protein